MRALSIRQPYAELILRGIKTAEYRSRPTRVIGERFWIYASKKKLPVVSGPLPVWSSDLEAVRPPAWMVELAKQVGMIEAGALLPTGVIVGSAVIDRCEEVDAPGSAMFRWHLKDVRRVDRLVPPVGHPQPVWFDPRV